jgi:sugar lactone lactonase YvrE
LASASASREDALTPESLQPGGGYGLSVHLMRRLPENSSLEVGRLESAPLTLQGGLNELPLTAATVTHQQPSVTLAGVIGGTLVSRFPEPGLGARFTFPCAVAVKAGGLTYVADTGDYGIRVISPDGSVQTRAGGERGCVDGPAERVRFQSSRSLAVGPDGSVYVADDGNHCIRKVAPTGVLTTLAGDDTAGHTDGLAGDARFRDPNGLAVDAPGTLCIADINSHRIICKVNPPGVVFTPAGDGTAAHLDGVGACARLSSPLSVAVDVGGDVYVVDTGNHRIR